MTTKDWMTVRIFLACGLMFALVACDDASSEPRKKENRATTIGKDESGINVYRFDDPELGIVCYRVESHDGLYCLRKAVPAQ